MAEYRRIEQLRDEVVAIRPVYSETGNITELILRSGERVVDKRIVNSTINALAKAFAIDLHAQRQQSQTVLGRKGAPFPFHLPPRRVFIPLKMRRPMAEKDSAYGYVELDYVGDIQAHSSRECVLTLANGPSLPICSSRKTILSAQRDGQEVLEHLEQEKNPEPMDDQVQHAINILVYFLATMLARQLHHITDENPVR
ncbi:MAG: hypothetical protein U9N81_14195 [Bacillota bacterium]|nr:hypothetical protein [Bacillota bacterium]